MSTRDPSRRYDSVQQDWRAFLPEAKAAFFYAHTGELENSYFAFSVSLNEAIGLRSRRGGLAVCDTVAISSELCSRFSLRVNSVLHGMRQRGRHFGILPNFTPLDPSNFRTERGQRAARSCNLLGKVLLSERSQFLNKIVTLENVIDGLETDYTAAVGHSGRAETASVGDLWAVLENCHYDLNTCLQETIVLLKSFLFALPEDQLDALDFTIRGLSRSRRPVRDSVVHAIRPRRMSAVAGK